MKHSPVLGINIPIDVWIDGRHSGAFTKGHVFERSLTMSLIEVTPFRIVAFEPSSRRTEIVRPGPTRPFSVAVGGGSCAEPTANRPCMIAACGSHW